MKKKQLIICLGVCICICVFLVSIFNKTNIKREDNLNTTQDQIVNFIHNKPIYNISTLENEIYYVGEQEIGILTENASTQKINCNTSLLDRIAVSTDYIAHYCYDEQSLKLYTLNGEFIQELNYNHSQIHKLKFVANKLFISTWQEVNSHQTAKNLAYIDLQDGTYHTIDFSSVIYTFDIGPIGELIVIQEENEKLYANILDLSTLKVIEHIEIGYVDDDYIEDVLSTPQGIYMCGANKIYQIIKDTTSISIIYEDIYRDFEGIPSNLISINSELYILCNKVLYKLESITDNTNLELNLLLSDEVDNRSDVADFQFFISKLRKKNIKSTINFNEISNYTEKLCTKLYSKDTTFDLFIVDFHNLSKLNSKYCAILDDNKDINNALDQMFNNLRNLTTRDNHLVAVPYDLSYEVFCINPNLEKEHNIDLNTMNQLSWTQFFDLCEENAIDRDQDGTYDVWLTEWTYERVLVEMINQMLVNNEINSQENIFATESFENLLVRLKELTLKGVILENINELDYNNSILLSTTYLSLVSERNKGHFIFPPVLNTTQPCYIVDGRALCINANSNNTELAEQVLLESIKPENNIPYGGLPIYKEKEYYETFYNSFLEEYPDMPNNILNGTRLEMNDDIFNKCEQLGKNMYGRYIYYLPETLHELIEDFIYNDIDIQKVIDVLNSEVKKGLEL